MAVAPRGNLGAPVFIVQLVSLSGPLPLSEQVPAFLMSLQTFSNRSGRCRASCRDWVLWMTGTQRCACAVQIQNDLAINYRQKALPKSCFDHHSIDCACCSWKS